MKKRGFRDFYYDNNDIFLVILILLIAAGVIAWRVQIIMSYPDTLVSGSKATSQSEAIAGGNKAVQDSSSSSAKTTTDEKVTAAKWDGDKLAEDIKVEVADGTATASVESLVQAKIFDNYDEYKKLCSSLNIDPTSINAGTYTFDKGMTKKDIVKEVTKK